MYITAASKEREGARIRSVPSVRRPCGPQGSPLRVAAACLPRTGPMVCYFYPPAFAPSVSVSVALCLCLSVSVSVALCLSLSVSVSLSLSLSLSVSVCLCLSLLTAPFNPHQVPESGQDLRLPLGVEGELHVPRWSNLTAPRKQFEGNSKDAD